MYRLWCSVRILESTVCRALASIGLTCVLVVLPALGQSRCAPSAHRGERGQAFDNSVEAILAARGIPYVEIDIRVTDDNDLILFHDRRLSPKNYRGSRNLIGRPVGSLTREELAAIRFPDGSRIAKLRTALREVEGRGITLMLDVKSTSARDFKRVMDDVYQAGAESRVVVQCQSSELVEYMRATFPRISVLARAHEESEVEPLLDHSPEFVQINHNWNLANLVPKIHERGGRVVVKTLSPETDRPVVWRMVCDAGVDVVLTDRPRDFLSSKGEGRGR